MISLFLSFVKVCLCLRLDLCSSSLLFSLGNSLAPTSSPTLLFVVRFFSRLLFVPLLSRKPCRFASLRSVDPSPRSVSSIPALSQRGSFLPFLLPLHHLSLCSRTRSRNRAATRSCSPRRKGKDDEEDREGRAQTPANLRQKMNRSEIASCTRDRVKVSSAAFPSPLSLHVSFRMHLF